jgi:hypothetical protein
MPFSSISKSKWTFAGSVEYSLPGAVPASAGGGGGALSTALVPVASSSLVAAGGAPAATAHPGPAAGVGFEPAAGVAPKPQASKPLSPLDALAEFEAAYQKLPALEKQLEESEWRACAWRGKAEKAAEAAAERQEELGRETARAGTLTVGRSHADERLMKG